MAKKSHSYAAAAPETARRSGNFISLLTWIALAAFLLRLIASWEMIASGGGCNNVTLPPAASDLRTYMTLAGEIAQGIFPKEFYYQPYYYSVFLPLVYFCSPGAVVPAVIGVQALLGGAAVFLTGLCGRKIHSERAGIIAACFTAFSVPLILYTPFHQNETLQSFHLILLLYLTLRMAEKPACRIWAFGGLTASAAILTRGNVWLLLPVVFGIPLAVLIRRKNPPRAVAASVLCFLLCLFLPMLPFCLRNSLSCGAFCGPSTAADAVLALGNSPEAPAGGREPGLPAGPMDYPEAFHRMMALSSQGVSVPRQMIRWFADQPAAFCELQFRKLLLFWDGREIPNNVSLEYDGFASALLRWDLIGRTALLLPFALAGILFFLPLLWRKHPVNGVILYAFSLCFCLAVAAFYLLSRFRAPILPVLFLFAGAFIDETGKRLASEKEKRFPLFLRYFLLLFFCFYLVQGAYDGYRLVEPAVMRFVRPQGTVLCGGGMPARFFDHGPEPFGGWEFVPAEPGMVLTKRFAGTEGETGELSLLLAAPQSAEIALSVNGEIQHARVPRGRHWLVFPVALNDGMCQIRFLRGSAPCFFVMDTQRRYGRSFRQGEPLPAEWVWRFGVR